MGAAQGAAQGYTGTQDTSGAAGQNPQDTSRGATQNPQDTSGGATQGSQNAAPGAGSPGQSANRSSIDQGQQAGATLGSTTIKDDVEDSLADLPKADDVNVAATPTGVVTLTGKVTSERERNRVLNMVGASPGVERIDDQLEVTGKK